MGDRRPDRCRDSRRTRALHHPVGQYLRSYLEMRKERPDSEKVARIMAIDIYTTASQGTAQVLIHYHGKIRERLLSVNR